ncbi:hypothetical protein SH449x_004655 [Pirellulaceae bacterium SH449]
MLDTNANPYRSPEAATQTHLSPWSKLTIISGALYVYPVLVISAIYTTWALTVLALGRIPVPYRDYTHNALIDFFAYVGFFLILGAPLAVPVGFFNAYCNPFGFVSTNHKTNKQRVASVFLYLLLLVASLAILFSDPWRVLAWYFD